MNMAAILIDHMGTDLTVVNAARVSFSKHSDVLDEKDAKLIRYLARNNHWTPFGHPQATFRLQAPIFVARQLYKHQVGLVVNEVSRRYVDDPPKFFMPNVWRSRPENAKQGSGGPIDEQDIATSYTQSGYTECMRSYTALLDMGVAPEQARMVLPQAMFIEWIWTGSLAAWARVCKLRLNAHAQEETQDLAGWISQQMSVIFPVSWEALLENYNA